jgi:hypothetical protein
MLTTPDKPMTTLEAHDNLGSPHAVIKKSAPTVSDCNTNFSTLR